MKFTFQRHRLAKRLIPNHRSPTPAPHHNTTEDQL